MPIMNPPEAPILVRSRGWRTRRAGDERLPGAWSTVAAGRGLLRGPASSPRTRADLTRGDDPRRKLCGPHRASGRTQRLLWREENLETCFSGIAGQPPYQFDDGSALPAASTAQADCLRFSQVSRRPIGGWRGSPTDDDRRPGHAGDRCADKPRWALSKFCDSPLRPRSGS